MFRLAIKNRACLRQLHQCRTMLKAQAFGMPAMSPTMERGGVVDWKFKAGDTFSAGDVLLEVETDKATIDVEAQDDGKLAKILKENGAKDIPVGEPIAYIADVDDDLATLEFPKPVEAKKESKPVETKKEEAKPVEKTDKKKQTSASKTPSKNGSVQANASQTLFPSVLSLLEENNISTADALDKIKATGPNGRILKGDVLAYLGKISQDSLNKVTEYIKSHEKLDLTNIELRPARETAAAAAAAAQAAKPAKPLPLVLSEQITLHVPENVTYSQLSAAIASYVKECSFLAHDEPLTNDASELYDPLFEELLVQEPTKPRFKVTYNIVDLEPTPRHRTSSPQPDIFDLLSGTTTQELQQEASAVSKQQQTRHEYALNVSVAVDESLTDAKQRAENFVAQLSNLELFQ